MNERVELPSSEVRDKRENGCEKESRTWRLNSGSLKINFPWSCSGGTGERNLSFRGGDRAGQGRTYNSCLTI